MLVVLLTAGVLVILCVATHLFVLEMLLSLTLRAHTWKRLRLGAMILGAISGHLVEIALFAVGLHRLARAGEFGTLDGGGSGFAEQFYFSAVTFTTLGYGDLTPTGALRYFAAVEALTGLVLIAWTASFAFTAMQRIWPRKSEN